MNFTARPAWRHQWFALGIVAFLLALFVYLAIVYVASAKGEYGIAIGFSLALAALLGVAVCYRKYSWCFVITGDIIESHQGIIGRNVKSIRVRDLRNINVRQSLMQRLLGIGDIEFSSSAGSDIEVSFRGICRPLEIKRQVQTLQGSG